MGRGRCKCTTKSILKDRLIIVSSHSSTNTMLGGTQSVPTAMSVEATTIWIKNERNEIVDSLYKDFILNTINRKYFLIPNDINPMIKKITDYYGPDPHMYNILIGVLFLTKFLKQLNLDKYIANNSSKKLKEQIVELKEENEELRKAINQYLPSEERIQTYFTSEVTHELSATRGQLNMLALFITSNIDYAWYLFLFGAPSTEQIPASEWKVATDVVDNYGRELIPGRNLNKAQVALIGITEFSIICEDHQVDNLHNYSAVQEETTETTETTETSNSFLNPDENNYESSSISGFLSLDEIL